MCSSLSPSSFVAQALRSKFTLLFTLFSVVMLFMIWHGVVHLLCLHPLLGFHLIFTDFSFFFFFFCEYVGNEGNSKTIQKYIPLSIILSPQYPLNFPSHLHTLTPCRQPIITLWLIFPLFLSGQMNKYMCLFYYFPFFLWKTSWTLSGTLLHLALKNISWKSPCISP